MPLPHCHIERERLGKREKVGRENRRAGFHFSTEEAHTPTRLRQDTSASHAHFQRSPCPKQKTAEEKHWERERRRPCPSPSHLTINSHAKACPSLPFCFCGCLPCRHDVLHFSPSPFFIEMPASDAAATSFMHSLKHGSIDSRRAAFCRYAYVIARHY